MQGYDWAKITELLPSGRSEKERLKRKQLFKMMDGNGSGLLTLAEIDGGLQDIIPLPKEFFKSKRPIMRAFQYAKQCGKSRGGKWKSRDDDFVDPREFRVLMISLRQMFEVWAMFDRIDSGDNDHKIDLEEFKAAVPMIELWGYKITDPVAEFKKVDTNGGGVIMFDEFLEWALKNKLDIEDDDDFEPES